MGRTQGVHATTVAAAFGAVGALCLLGAAREYHAQGATEFHVRPSIPVVPQPHTQFGAFGRSAQHVPGRSSAVQDRPKMATALKAVAYASLDEAEDAFNAASKALDTAYDKAEVILMWLLKDDAKELTVEKAEKAVRLVDDLLQQRKAAAASAADPVQAQALVEKALRKQLLLNNVLSALLNKQEAEQALANFGRAAADVPMTDGPKKAPTEAVNNFANADEAQQAFNAASVALQNALDKAEVILMWLLKGDAKDMTLAKAEKAAKMVEDLLQQRKEAAKRVIAGTENPGGDVLAAEKSLAAAEANVKAASSAAGRGVAEAEAALKAATEAERIAIDKAEMILIWLLGEKDAKHMTLEKADKAMDLISDLVQQRKSAAHSGASVDAAVLVEKAERKELLLFNVQSAMLQKQEAQEALEEAKKSLPSDSQAVLNEAKAGVDAAQEAVVSDPLQAMALVEKAERKQLLINNVMSAMLQKQEAQEALRQYGIIDPNSKEELKAVLYKNEAEEAVRAATEDVNKAVERAEVILMWILKDDYKDITLEKIERALMQINDLVLQRKKLARRARKSDKLQALSLVEKALTKQLLLSNVRSAMLKKEEAEQALAAATGTELDVPPRQDMSEVLYIYKSTSTSPGFFKTLLNIPLYPFRAAARWFFSTN